jgi:hypothetical protein
MSDKEAAESLDPKELHPDLLPKALMPGEVADPRTTIIMGFRATVARLRLLADQLRPGSRLDLKCIVCRHAVVLSKESVTMLSRGMKLFCEVCADAHVRSGGQVRSVQTPEHVFNMLMHRAQKRQQNAQN